MAESNQSTPIELQGIVHNLSQIKIKDGQAEDLLNLRFKDGSWRTSGDGKKVFTLPTDMDNKTYTNLYIHTNNYRHLLGVKNGKLYWFANIEEDGETFTTIGAIFLTEANPQSVSISQTGNLLVVLQEGKRVAFFFNEDKGIYEEQDTLDKMGGLPYEEVQFKCEQEKDAEGRYKFFFYNPAPKFHDYNFELEYDKQGDGNYPVSPASLAYGGASFLSTKEGLRSLYLDSAQQISSLKSKLKDFGYFHGSFLVSIALQMYDGSWAYATEPTLVTPSYNGDFIQKSGHGTIVPSETESLEKDEFEYPIYVPDVFSKEGSLSDLSSDGSDRDGVHKQGYFASGDIKTISVTDCFTHKRTEQQNGVYYPSNTPKPLRVDIPMLPNVFQTIISTAVERTSIPSYSRTYTKSIVTGKCNSFYFKVGKLNVQEGVLYKKVGIFVSPILESTNVATTGDDNKFHANYNRVLRNAPYGNAVPMIPYYGFQTIGDYYHSRDSREDVVGNFFSTVEPKRLGYKEYRDNLKNATLHLLKEYDIDELNELRKQGDGWIKVDIERGTLTNLLSEDELTAEALNYQPFSDSKQQYMYNGRLHLANYKQSPVVTSGIELYSNRDKSSSGYSQDVGHGGKKIQYLDMQYTIAPIVLEKYSKYFALTYQQLPNGLSGTKPFRMSILLKDSFHLPPFIPINQEDVDSISLYVNRIIGEYNAERTISYTATLPCDKKDILNFYGTHFWLTNEMEEYHDFDAEGKQLNVVEFKEKDTLAEPINSNFVSAEQYISNGIRVSKTNNPLFFPVENVYRVGNGRIVAMMSNAVAVGSGQTGAAPLYVFCTDGVYALMVDSSGSMAYTSARIISREICNNPLSVTPTDAGVVFTTDRGLMCIAGTEVIEIGQPLEGDYLDFTNPNAEHQYINMAKNAFTHPRAGAFSLKTASQIDFLTYLKGCVINYNHNERELMVSNPKYNYSYVLDNEGYWSRRNYTCNEYVNNYPTSYRMQGGVFYKVDEEQNGRDTADNRFFYLSQIIKLSSLQYKQGYRFIVRGMFDTGTDKKKYSLDGIGDTSLFIYNNVEQRKDALELGDYNITFKVRTDERFPSGYIDDSEYRIDFKYYVLEEDNSYTISSHIVKPDTEITIPYRVEEIENVEGEYLITVSITNITHPTYKVHADVTIKPQLPKILCCYVFGSYDGRKWTMLGGNERSGSFVDIGCRVERTDVRFFRVCLAGNLTGDSRIDYMEMSAEPSKLLSTKIR